MIFFYLLSPTASQIHKKDDITIKEDRCFDRADVWGHKTTSKEQFGPAVEPKPPLLTEEPGLRGIQLGSGPHAYSARLAPVVGEKKLLFTAPTLKSGDKCTACALWKLSIPSTTKKPDHRRLACRGNLSSTC